MLKDLLQGARSVGGGLKELLNNAINGNTVSYTRAEQPAAVIQAEQPRRLTSADLKFQETQKGF